MKGSIRRLVQLSVLAVVMMVPVLAAAGPVLAADPFRADHAVKKGGAHEINGRLIEMSREVVSESDEHVVYAVVTDDPRVNGIMDLWVAFADVTEDGDVFFSGWWHIVTAFGSWHADYFEGLESAGYLVEKPYRITVIPGVATGGGDLEGLVLQYGAHRGAGPGATFIMKGSLVEAE